MVLFWSRFSRSRFFLSAYLIAHAAALGAIAWWHPLGLRGPVESRWLIALVPAALFLGLKIPTVMHNCMHGNLRFANYAIGELTAFFILMSFGVVCIQHTLHHAHPDSELDPHAPAGKPFWVYWLFSQFLGARATELAFLNRHGNTAANRFLCRANFGLHLLGNGLRGLIWFQLLGPWFSAIYLPAYAAYLFVFAHVNYFTHVSSEIRNLQRGFYYRSINRICDGVYFHQNHHRYPRLADPRRLAR